MHLTVIPIDKIIYLETPNAIYYPTNWPMRRAHFIINDEEFWNSVDPRIHAIQYHTDGQKEIELKNPSENVSITDISILQKYIDRFNLTEQTYQQQITWDKDFIEGETKEQKITRLGPRP
jgi:ABC-type uncharacterized transport system ATPase subunit